MDLERLVILSIALLYGLWGVLLVGHSLLQMRRKSLGRRTIEDKATKAVSVEVDDTYTVDKCVRIEKKTREPKSQRSLLQI